MNRAGFDRRHNYPTLRRLGLFDPLQLGLMRIDRRCSTDA